MNEERQKFEITTASWIKGVIVVALAYAFYLVGEFVLVIMASIVIASALEPMIHWAKKRSVPRLPMVILIYVIIAFILAGLFYFLLLPLIGDMTDFLRTLTIYSNSVTDGGVLSDLFQTQNVFGGLDTPMIIGELTDGLNYLATFLSQGLFSSVSNIFGGVLTFILIITLSFHLAAQEDGVSKFLKIITPVKHENYVIGLWHRSQKKIGLWMQGQLLASLMVMILVYIGLLIAGVPHALLLAVLAGVFDLVPIIGPILASIPAIFVAFIFGGPSMALIVALIYLVVQQIENNVIFPLVHKKLAGVPAMVSIAALVIGGILAGFLGILISVPVAAAVMEFVYDIEERKAIKVSE